MATKQSPDLAHEWVEANAPEPPSRSSRWRFRWFNYWQFWAAIAILLSGSVGGLSYHLLLRQPGPPKCDTVVWPFASASLRLYCAQQKASQPSLENLFEAIGLVDVLGHNHPLRSAINPLIERWSTQALDQAEEAFHKGKLDRAIEFAQKIPAQTTAHDLVEDRIQRWRTVWAEGEAIYAKAEATLEQEDWRKAFSIMVGLLEVDSRYWSATQYEALNQTIIGAQQDEIKLGKIQRLRRTGSLESLAKALGLAQDLGPESVFRKSAQSEIIQISRNLMGIAENALERENLNLALEALNLIPRNVALWPEAQDMTEIAYAMSSAWSGSITNLEDAIAQLRKIGPDRPLYDQAQALSQQWVGQIGHARLLQQAQDEAQSGSIPDLTTAILQAQQISTDSPFWKDAQAEIQDWRRQLQLQEDSPILNQADQLSQGGDRAALVAAIQQAQQIQPGRVLYDAAQARIRDWQTQVQRIDSPVRVAPAPYSLESLPSSQEPVPAANADPNARVWQQAQSIAAQNTPDALVAAMETASRIPRDSPLHFEASRAMDQWGRQLLQTAQEMASTDREGAIAIAERIPPTSGAYEAAQLQLQRWQQSELAQPPAP